MHNLESSDQAKILECGASRFIVGTRLAAGDWPSIRCALGNRLLSAGAIAGSEEDFFAFGDGGISILSNGGGLDIQVFAGDILTLVGIRTMLEGCLHEVPGHPFKSIKWQSGQASAQSTYAAPNSKSR